MTLESLQFKIDKDFTAYKSYLDLLSKWNKAYNLTSIRGEDAMLRHHVLDSLAVLPFIEGKYCLDVGTGAGLPGLILAIAQPQQHWTLIDSNIKKTRFVSQVKLELELDNVEIIHGRIEDFSSDSRYDTVICRAFTALKDFYLSCERFRKDTGVLLAMKPAFPEDELKELKQNTQKVTFNELKGAGIEGNSGLFVIRG